MEVGKFPLFCHLKNELPTGAEEPLTPAQMESLVDKVKELDDQGCSLVYALIRYYQIYETKNSAVDAPFQMKKVKSGYRFCVEDLPPTLQHLILCFADIHLRTQAERQQPA